MAKIKNIDASEEVSNYIIGLESPMKEICLKLREIILGASADIIEEWKWGPHYSCMGMVCGFAGFQKHAKLTFFNGSAMKDQKGIFNHCTDNLFSRSIKFTEVGEINEALIRTYVLESISLNKKGFKRVIDNKHVEVPSDLMKALSENKKAKTFFDALSYGYKKEGVGWIESAKREETRKERIAKLVEMHSEGLRMNDKYRVK